MIKWHLSQGCKDFSISTNQLVLYTTSINWRIKTIWYSWSVQKSFWQNSTPTYGKNSPESGHRNKIYQYNKGYTTHTHKHTHTPSYITFKLWNTKDKEKTFSMTSHVVSFKKIKKPSKVWWEKEHRILRLVD